MTENNIVSVFADRYSEQQAKLRAAMVKKVTGDEDVTVINPVDPIDPRDPDLLSQWVIEMSRGQYGTSNFKHVGELVELVQALPLTDVDMINFLHRVARGRLRVAAQSIKELLWLIWDGRSYVEFDESITNTILQGLIYVLHTVQEDISDRASDIFQLEPKDPQVKLASAWISEVQKYVKHMKSDAGQKALRNIILGKEGMVFKESDHADDAQGYVVEANGKMRHIDNLDILLDPDPTLLIRHRLSVCATEDWVDHGTWSQFLLEVFGDPDDNGGFIRNEGKELLLQETAGAALMGTGKVKNLINIVGPSNAGKSLYIDAITRVFGDYQHRLTNTAIVKTSGANFYQDEARGKRLVYISEPDEKNVDEPFLKSLTGGANEKLTTAQKGKASVSWTPQCFLHIVSNKPIKFDLSDDALNLRLLTVAAANSVERTDPRWNDNRVDDIVKKDLETIYRWILDGAKRLIENGHKLTIPGEVTDIQEERSRNANSAVMWLYHKEEEGYLKVDSSTKSMSRMYKWTVTEYEHYVMWAGSMGLPTLDYNQAKDAIETHTKKPINKNTGNQSGYPRLWGVVPIDRLERF